MELSGTPSVVSKAPKTYQQGHIPEIYESFLATEMFFPLSKPHFDLLTQPSEIITWNFDLRMTKKKRRFSFSFHRNQLSSFQNSYFYQITPGFVMMLELQTPYDTQE